MASATIELQPAYVYKGEDALLHITMNPVVDITGRNFVFTVRTEKGENGILMLQKTMANGITLSDPTAGELTIDLDKEDTNSLDVGQYYYDVWRVDADNYYPIIEPSIFKVYPSVYQIGQ